MNLKKIGLSIAIASLFSSIVKAQADVDRGYIQDYVYPYVARISLERTGAGLQISPDYTVIPATASFPFNTGTNIALHVYYKFLNFSISQTINSKTNNKSFVIALAETAGPVTVGGKLGFYSNVAALDDKQVIDTKSSINLFKFSPFWLANFNHTRFSLAAVTDYSKRQRKSAGAFMFEINPFIMRAKGKDGNIIPTGGSFDEKFDEMAGLRKLTVYNLDVRPGFMYTLSFEEGTYFLSGGLFVGAGFGYHHAVSETKTTNGLHWQTSARILASGGYNQEKYFIAAALRYNNSFTPVANIGVLSNEATFQLTFGLRFNSFEEKLPSNF
ncbi:MAG: DUF4421 family protein [Chitinophagaceae bacterium]|nr:DUF4421 family protein [Chitinophagaceae bacterium]